MRAVKRVLAALVGERRRAPGAMIETPQAANQAQFLAQKLDFLSLGTNDLVQLVLGLGRERASSSPIGHPQILGLIDATVRAAHPVGIPVEICGEAASQALSLPLLVGLDVDEISVGAARVGEVRSWVREMRYADCRQRALALLRKGGHTARQGA